MTSPQAKIVNQVAFPTSVMAATKERLREQLTEMGEHPPTRWTKAELQQRVEELTGINATVRSSTKEVSEYRRLIQEMNTAAKKKAHLQKFCAETLRMSQIDSYSIPQLVRAATLEIYHRSAPDPTDMVGFGKHANLMYSELKDLQPTYCQWVVQTAGEGEADPRLLRLAGWLNNQPEYVARAVQQSKARTASSSASSMPPKSTSTSKTKMISGSRGQGYTRASSHSETPDDKIDKLQAMMMQLQEELSELKQEPARKKKGFESDSDNVSDQSFAMVLSPKKN